MFEYVDRILLYCVRSHKNVIPSIFTAFVMCLVWHVKTRMLLSFCKDDIYVASLSKILP